MSKEKDKFKKNNKQKDISKQKGDNNMLDNTVMIKKNNECIDFVKPSKCEVMKAIKECHKKHKKTMDLLSK